MGELNTSYIVGGNVKRHNYFFKVWQDLQKLNTYLLYDPETPHLGIYPRKFKSRIIKRQYTYVHSSFSYNEAKKLKQCKCPFTL